MSSDQGEYVPITKQCGQWIVTLRRINDPTLPW